MAVKSRMAGIAPWSGMIAAAAGFGLYQQLVSESLHFDCRAGSGGVAIGIGVAALVLVVVGAAMSWRARPPAHSHTEPATLRRFIVEMSLMAAVLASLGIVFQVLASALLPGCPP